MCIALVEVLKVERVKGRELLVPGLTLLALALIGLIALLEKGPLHVISAPGAYPGNTGPLGTSTLYQKLKENYTVIPVTSWEAVRQLLGECNVSVVAVIVSPEVPYTAEDVEAVKSLMSSCTRLGLLVADESGLSNTILSAIGSSVRIEGTIIQPYYVVALIETPWGWSGRLLLDKASRVYTVAQGGGAEPIGFVEGAPIAIAYHETLPRGEVVVVGDGSILLNQVLQSSLASYYLSFATSTVSHLCGSKGGCIVLLEASKYTGLDPVSVLTSGDERLLALLNPVDIILGAVAKLLHPSTWLPPIMSIVDYGIRSLLDSSPYFKGLIVVLIAILAALMAPREGRVRDTPLSDVVEVEWYGFGRFRRVLELRGAKLSKEDFIALYNLVDTALKATVGSSIEDPQLPQVLQALGLDRGFVERFRGYMLRYYRRATGKTLWPPVVFWGRVTRRALEMSESILEPLGASLFKLSRLERIEEKGLRIAGS